MNIVLGLTGAIFAVVVGYFVVVVAVETGPGCPNNPEWLGFCNQAPAQ